MKSLKYIVASGIVSIAALAGLAGNVQAATVAPTNKCTVSDFGMAMGKSGNITVEGSKATVKYRVNGTNCTTPVTIAVWKRVTPTGISDQKLYTYLTQAAVQPGLHTATVNLPNCLYQVDVLESAKPTADDGTANYVKYDEATKKFLPSPLRDFIKPEGTNVCTETAVPPVTVTPTPTTPTPVTTTKAPVASVMPSTGAGDVLMGTTGLSTSVGLAYNLIRRKKMLR